APRRPGFGAALPRGTRDPGRAARAPRAPGPQPRAGHHHLDVRGRGPGLRADRTAAGGLAPGTAVAARRAADGPRLPGAAPEPAGHRLAAGQPPGPGAHIRMPQKETPRGCGAFPGTTCDGDQRWPTAL